MTYSGPREQAEREVLATLLQDGQAFQQLPEGFGEDAFEILDYRKLYCQMLRFIRSGKGISEAELVSENPELEATIRNVLWATSSLNGRLRGRASGLMRHQPEPIHGKTDLLEKPFPSSSKNAQNFRFQVFSGEDILKMEIPERSFVVKDLLSEESVNFLSGEEGCGKSLLAMNLGICVALGASRWLNFDIAKPGPVIFLNNEIHFGAYGRRLKAMGERLPARGNLRNLIVPNEVPALTECWDAVNELCDEVKPRLVILDCLYFSHDEDENDSSRMKALMRKFLALRDRYATAVLIIHHTKKGARYSTMNNDQMRGSNVFGGITDSVLQMRRSASNECLRILKPTKFRHVSDENRKCRLLSLDPVSLWFRDEGETHEEEHIAMPQLTAKDEIDFSAILKPGEEVSRKAILERCSPLGYDERTIDRLLKRAKAAEVLKTPRFGIYSL